MRSFIRPIKHKNKRMRLPGLRHTKSRFNKPWVAAVMLLLVLLSLCPVKYSIKSLLGSAHRVEHPANAKASLYNSQHECANYSVSETVANNAQQLFLFSPIFLFSVILFSLFGKQINCAKRNIWEGKLSYPLIPIFLQNRRLLI